MIRFLLVCAVGLAFSSRAQPRETLTQISTIDALMNGVYDGDYPLRDLLAYGDFGLGTFDALDGEMTVLDGRIYQIPSDGHVRLPDLNWHTPFAAVTFFEADRQEALPAGMSLDQFEQATDHSLPTLNLFFAIKLEGRFHQVKTRSVPKQSKPYPTLTDAAKKQSIFEFNDVEGTMVGFRCPPFVNGLNVPGYHIHFLTKDRSAGGHVLAFTTQDVQVQIDDTPEFTVKLPHSAAFYRTDLTADKSAEVKAVEKQTSK